VEIPIDLIDVGSRVRKEIGDVDSLARSIEENGLISPIMLTTDGTNGGRYVLVAGERRLRAMQKLGISTLIEGEHFKWKQDIDEYRKIAIELEENIRRKQFTWSEEVLGKQKLLEIYQNIYGAPSAGAQTRQERMGLKPVGFGVRKLSELLGESATNTSDDLELAALVTKIPSLATEDSKDAARRKLTLAVKIMAGQSIAPIVQPLVFKILITCQSEAHQKILLHQLRTAGLDCKPLVS